MKKTLLFSLALLVVIFILLFQAKEDSDIPKENLI